MNETVRKAAVAVGVTLGFGASLFGAPLWSVVLVGVGGTLAAAKTLEKIA